jgi:hypothetical protein
MRNEIIKMIILMSLHDFALWRMFNLGFRLALAMFFLISSRVVSFQSPN